MLNPKSAVPSPDRLKWSDGSRRVILNKALVDTVIDAQPFDASDVLYAQRMVVSVACDNANCSAAESLAYLMHPKLTEMIKECSSAEELGATDIVAWSGPCYLVVLPALAWGEKTRVVSHIRASRAEHWRPSDSDFLRAHLSHQVRAIRKFGSTDQISLVTAALTTFMIAHLASHVSRLMAETRASHRESYFTLPTGPLLLYLCTIPVPLDRAVVWFSQDGRGGYLKSLLACSTRPEIGREPRW